MTLRKPIATYCIFLGCLFLNTGCSNSTTVKESASKKSDMFENWNHRIQRFNDDVDEAILKPIAKEYLSVTSKEVETGVTNFFNNIDDIGVSVNDLLQFKLVQSGMDVSRFIVNTTAGVLGVMDVAQLIDLPKHNEDFGQTLGVWGIPAGDYLILPFFGPSTTRDTFGRLGDALLNPFNYTFLFGGGIAVSAATASLNAVDITNTRAMLMGTEKMVNEAATDRYSFIKNAYLQRREYLIHDGNVPADKDIDLLDEEDNLPNTSSIAPPSKQIPPVHLPIEKSQHSTTPFTAQPMPSNKNAVDMNTHAQPDKPQMPKAKPPIKNNYHHFLELSAPK